jgi:hypothetical protein
MLIVNNQWNIIDPPGNYNLRLNLFINNNVLGDNLTFELLNKNTIRIRAMPIKFIDMFAQANKMQIVMPGSISNVIVNLSKSSQAVDFMTQCVDTYKSTKKRVTTPSKRLDL